jgi:transcriptional regulator with XRE-family HTH domain
MTENELRAIVRTNIRRYRNYRKWTQAELAEKLDISINFLSDIENGKKWISPSTMVKFASALNIEPYELFKPADALPPPVAALFSKYNVEVVQAVSNSLKHIYDYYQAQIEAEFSPFYSKKHINVRGCGKDGE